MRQFVWSEGHIRAIRVGRALSVEVEVEGIQRTRLTQSAGQHGEVLSGAAESVEGEHGNGAVAVRTVGEGDPVGEVVVQNAASGSKEPQRRESKDV